MPDPNANNGLLPEQIAPFERWLNKEIRDAFTYATGQWKMPERKENEPPYTVQETEAANAREQARPLYKEVAYIVQNSKDDATLNASLEQLKADKLAIAKAGPPKKGFFEIFLDAISDLNPIAMIAGGIESAMSGGSFLAGINAALKTALFSGIRDTAIAYGSDSTAGWMKAFKDNLATWWQTKSWGTKSTEQASAELQLGLGAEAFAASLDVDSKHVPAIARGITTAVENERKNPSSVPEDGFSYKLPSSDKPEEPKQSAAAPATKTKKAEEASADASPASGSAPATGDQSSNRPRSIPVSFDNLGQLSPSVPGTIGQPRQV